VRDACAALVGEENRSAAGGSFLRGGGGHQRGAGGPVVEMSRGAGAAWGLASTGGRRPDRLRPGRGARRRRADAADAWAPTVGGRGSEKREARARVGRPGETRSGPSRMNSNI
jgi:hypothetical protein